jgi:hypothetical protein
MKYYVVVGVAREDNPSEAAEIINGFYSRKDAIEEKECHKHSYKKLRVVPLAEDTQEAYNGFIEALSRA